MKKRFIRIALWTRNITIFLFVLSLLPVLLYKYVPVCYTPQMLTRRHISHRWRPLTEISQHLTQAVVASEDNFFLIHNGFNNNRFVIDSTKLFRSMLLRENKTVSQQTADAVFLLSGRSSIHNALETYFTLLIEFVWGKKRIMEVYLNTKEMGDGIFGAEAIAEKKFQKTAAQLSASEAALITTAFPNPKMFDSGKPTSYMLKQQAKTATLMAKIIPVEMGGSTSPTGNNQLENNAPTGIR
ncbi:MAG: transglycosylase domain-containing protein [Dysgonamonadaceae bacterium]|jgi:monofunctional biosynthetic peptidoglycan transglycosylase|nr:transglycosylase domain-containing protein [Dysgonamonadaceae bacterium]